MRSAALIVAILSVPVAAPPTDSNVVTLRGCVDHMVLTTRDESGGSGDREFDLRGDKRITKLLKEHSGHREEVTGVLKNGRTSQTDVAGEKRVGRGRVYVGARRDTASGAEPVNRPTIQVRDVTHLADRCSR